MTALNMKEFLKNVLKNVPEDWLELTTHRLDIYNEALAKTEFLEQFDNLYQTQQSSKEDLANLPTAYDYIRLGHPLSSVLEWAIATQNQLDPKQIIAFSSTTMGILAVLRKNTLNHKFTRIFYSDKLPSGFNEQLLKNVYGYSFELIKIKSKQEITREENSSNLYLNTFDKKTEQLLTQSNMSDVIDFYVYFHTDLGSIIIVNDTEKENYIAEIQHVRRRESIAMTPANCFAVLQTLAEGSSLKIDEKASYQKNKQFVLSHLKKIVNTDNEGVLASCGLSVQYAIMMGLIEHAQENYPNKEIKIVVPPNCYGGTNDQARRVAASIANTAIVDLPVDGDYNMVESTEKVLHQIALDDAIPFIIAEIPTNPRVEVPDLDALKIALSKERKTAEGKQAIKPVFILDQTFCPNVHFLGENDILSPVQTLSYVSGSKFPSGGKCTAGYCISNDKAAHLLQKIDKHLSLCNNHATPLQVAILAQQLPSMNDRIFKAYQHTREFVDFIAKTLPTSKINFVSTALAEAGFTPSVFSLDLPAKGNTVEEKENYKRSLNKQLIRLMIEKIPDECKHCVSYGQLKGSYWTIPATSTQGTTKESAKDYIVRVSLSPNMDIEKHKKVFAEFASNL